MIRAARSMVVMNARRKARIFSLACKYWLQGDSWGDAVKFAKRITDPFSKKARR